MSKEDSRASKTSKAGRKPRVTRSVRRPGEAIPVWPDAVKGSKYVKQLDRLVAKLREENPHGNRELFLDDVFIAHLLAFFNPTVRSLRTIEDFSQTKQVQKVLDRRRISKSTLSDYHKIADPEKLQPIIAHLRATLSRKYAGQRLPADLEILGDDPHQALHAVGGDQRQHRRMRPRLVDHVGAAGLDHLLRAVAEAGELVFQGLDHRFLQVDDPVLAPAARRRQLRQQMDVASEEIRIAAEEFRDLLVGRLVRAVGLGVGLGVRFDRLLRFLAHGATL